MEGNDGHKQLRRLVINTVISGNGHDIKLDKVYESTRRKGRSRRAPRMECMTATGRGPHGKLAYVGEIKASRSPRPTSYPLVVLVAPEFCSRDRHYVGGWWVLRSVALESAGASLCLFLHHAEVRWTLRKRMGRTSRAPNPMAHTLHHCCSLPPSSHCNCTIPSFIEYLILPQHVPRRAYTSCSQDTPSSKGNVRQLR